MADDDMAVQKAVSRLIAWLQEEPRRAPAQAFTAGPLREAADWVEAVVGRAVLVKHDECMDAAVRVRLIALKEAERIVSDIRSTSRSNAENMGLQDAVDAIRIRRGGHTDGR